jgi:hypothetical protein
MSGLALPRSSPPEPVLLFNLHLEEGAQQGRVRAVVYSASDADAPPRIAVAWDASPVAAVFCGDTGRQLFPLVGHGGGGVACIAAVALAQGVRLFTGGDDHTIRMYDAADGAALRVVECGAATIRTLCPFEDPAVLIGGDSEGHHYLVSLAGDTLHEPEPLEGVLNSAVHCTTAYRSSDDQAR